MENETNTNQTESSLGGIFGTIIIIVLLLAGGWYFINRRIEKIEQQKQAIEALNLEIGTSTENNI